MDRKSMEKNYGSGGKNILSIGCKNKKNNF